MRWIYYKLRQVLQSAMIVTNCGSTQLHSKFELSGAFLYISETTRTNFFKISPRNLHNLYNNVMKISLRLITSNTLTFQDKPILRTGQKSALQRSLFWRFANFSNFMRTIHISMTSAFQCECCQCFTFKRCDKFKLKCTSHGGMYISHYFGKISITSKQWILQRTFLTGS